MTDDRRLLSVPEAYRALGIGRSKLFTLISEGRIATVAIGRRRLVPVEALDAFVADLKREAA
jgi:excisionase family DNA binding protein